MQNDENFDGIRKINLGPSPKTMHLAAEADRMMEKVEAAGWNRNVQAKALNAHPPGYLKAIKHIHDIASMAGDAVHNMEMAAGGNLIDNQNNAEQL